MGTYASVCRHVGVWVCKHVGMHVRLYVERIDYVGR